MPDDDDWDLEEAGPVITVYCSHGAPVDDGEHVASAVRGIADEWEFFSARGADGLRGELVHKRPFGASPRSPKLTGDATHDEARVERWERKVAARSHEELQRVYDRHRYVYELRCFACNRNLRRDIADLGNVFDQLLEHGITRVNLSHLVTMRYNIN
jgi:hypothetical protein